LPGGRIHGFGSKGSGARYRLRLACNQGPGGQNLANAHSAHRVGTMGRERNLGRLGGCQSVARSTWSLGGRLIDTSKAAWNGRKCGNPMEFMLRRLGAEPPPVGGACQ
jgi:hypothetical protein